MSNGLNISLKSYDSIFQSEEQRNTEEIKPVPISELKPFTEQPFKVKLDEDMDALVESIKQCGVLTPVIARPHKDGGYEILSGHRRVKACELAGITDIPVVVKNLDDDTATILLVDSNLQREHILPSEKAFAYQMKLNANDEVGEIVKTLINTERDTLGTVQRLCRSVYCLNAKHRAELLEMIESGEITTAAEGIEMAKRLREPMQMCR